MMMIPTSRGDAIHVSRIIKVDASITVGYIVKPRPMTKKRRKAILARERRAERGAGGVDLPGAGAVGVR